MTTHENGKTTIQREPKQQCDLCGKIAELRPYGPNGECVCFDCGMKNPTATLNQFTRRLSGRHPKDQHPTYGDTQ